MIVRFLFAVAVAASVSACVTDSLPAQWAADQAHMEALLPGRIVLREDVRVGPEMRASFGVIRTEDGPALAVSLPVQERADGVTEQTYFYRRGWQPEQVYTLDLGDDGRREIALRMPGAIRASWLILRGEFGQPCARPGFWFVYEVPDELFDPDGLGAELVLEFDSSAFD